MGKREAGTPDFRIVGGPKGIKGIQCQHCGRVSYHPDDVTRRRCPFENRFLQPRPDEEHAIRG